MAEMESCRAPQSVSDSLALRVRLLPGTGPGTQCSESLDSELRLPGPASGCTGTVGYRVNDHDSDVTVTVTAHCLSANLKSPP